MAAYLESKQACGRWVYLQTRIQMGACTDVLTQHDQGHQTEGSTSGRNPGNGSRSQKWTTGNRFKKLANLTFENSDLELHLPSMAFVGDMVGASAHLRMQSEERNKPCPWKAVMAKSQIACLICAARRSCKVFSAGSVDLPSLTECSLHLTTQRLGSRGQEVCVHHYTCRNVIASMTFICNITLK